MQRNCVSSRGIAYVDSGRGDSVLLVHAIGMDADMWKPQVAALNEAGYRTLVPDHRGFGHSTPPGPDFTFQVIVEDMADLIDHAGAERVVSVGVSMGAATSAALAVQHPEKVGGLMIADNLLADGEQRGENASRRIRNLGLAGLADVYEVVLFGKDFREANPRYMDGWRQRLLELDSESLATLVAAYHARPHLGSSLSSIAVPTRVVYGEHDAAAPVERRHEYTAIPGSVLSIIPGVGHISNLEAPDAFNEILFDLLGDVYAT